MKKLSKLIYSIFAFALITCMAIFMPAIVDVSAEEPTLSAKSISISTGKISGTLEAGKELYIPMPTVKNAASAEEYIVVRDRSGYTYTYNRKTGETINDKTKETVEYFTLLDSNKTVTTDPDAVAYIQPTIIGKGTYTIQYKVKSGSHTYYSDVQSVQVKGDAYSWEFKQDGETNNIIPSITAQYKVDSKTGNELNKFALPLPKIVNIVDEDNKVTVHEFTTEDLLDNHKGKNIVITKGGDDVTEASTEVAEGKVYFKPTLADNEDTATYTIKYKSTVTAFANRTYTVKVDRNYKSEAKLEVSHNSITNVQVGAKTTFPTPNVTDKTHNKTGVEVNTVIRIKKGSEEIARLENEFTYKFENSGNYTIYYDVTDAYGNTATSAAYSISVSNKKPYMIAYADSYKTDIDNWEDEVVTGVDYTIPSEVGYNGFWLPAVYAKDYVTTDSTKLTYSRRLESTTDATVYFDLDKDDAEHGNAAYDETKKFNDRVLFKFPGDASKYAGQSFKLIYTAKGENDIEAAEATIYTIKIANKDVLSYNIDKNMIINFPTINEAIDPTAEFTFTTATAKEEPLSSELVADERVEVRTYYYYGAKTEIENAVKTHIQNVTSEYNQNPENTDEYNEKYGYDFDTFITGFTPSYLTKLNSKDGKTTFKLDGTQYTNQGKVTIFAVAINDQGQFLVKAREVAINNSNDDKAPTMFTPVEHYTGTYDQNVVVELPEVSFTDDFDKSLQVEVSCYVDTPDQTVGVRIGQFVQDTLNNKWGIKAAELTTTYAGTYYVVYTATDDAGNKVSYVSTFDVANTEKAYIEVENGSNITKNVGEEVVFNVNLAGNGDYDDEFTTTITWGENKPSGLGSQPNSFKFDKAGTYVATINVEYTMNGKKYQAEPSVTVTVTVVEPDLKWEDGVGELLANRTADKDEKIELPVVSATENGVQINATPKVVFVDSNGKETEVEVKFDEETFNNYYFVADKNGVYKVTYTATTDYNSASKSFTVTCGDYYEPTITIANNKLQDAKLVYAGKDLKFNVKSFNQLRVDEVAQAGKYVLTVEIFEGDSEKAKHSYDINVDLKDMNIDRNTVDLNVTSSEYSFSLSGDHASSNGTNSWTISGVGSNYELKLTVQDENGNSTTKSINFSVISKQKPKSIKDGVVGVVLIVVSAVVLGGVILFFALAGKRNKSKRKTVKFDNKD